MLNPSAKHVNANHGDDSPALKADGPAAITEPLRRPLRAAILNAMRERLENAKPSQANLESLTGSCAA